jgi:hypothetical protein
MMQEEKKGLSLDWVVRWTSSCLLLMDTAEQHGDGLGALPSRFPLPLLPFSASSLWFVRWTNDSVAGPSSL